MCAHVSTHVYVHVTGAGVCMCTHACMHVDECAGVRTRVCTCPVCMHARVCMHMCAWVHMCMHMCAGVSIFEHVQVYACMGTYGCAHACMCPCVHVHTDGCVYVSVCVCTCVCKHM